MITVKRYNPDAAMSISREHAWMRETPEGGHVEYGDYASLFAQFELVKAERDALERQLSMSEAKCKGYFSDAAAALVRCDALAVENQALSAALSLISGSYGLSPHIQSMCAVDTPTTDSALAAIQAQGVEKFAAALDALSAQSASATTQANFRAAAVYLRAEVLPAIGEAK
ncbi:hypothetical protein [Serratia marcescens]|uniref:hypothetical protein n=1 Tax=Serratia marcescens TaxID=615 RepID=UPI0007452ADA|nr:hypothetical protein [Serratia marcescens]CVB12720.1 Uncharacterised protein [Serratia marcescens]CVB60575.1 Uncharacterised protein [Serratia marcescens]CVC61235.1 Uncharacterised protein [Serratia marcescens]CVD25285.1 Uncharacterised protein [Serratia marcescens]CVE34829.1 Uncharacterised protein [Serratia marcescens]